MMGSVVYRLAAAAIGLCASAAMAADAVVKAPSAGLPAVSVPNYKLEALGGTLNNHSFGALAGSYTVPVQRNFGFQVDVLGGSWAGSALYGVGAHWFWRDPSVALFGFYADYLKSDRRGNNDVTRLAGEFELYRGNFTIEGLVGAEFGSVPNRFFNKVDLAYYIHPNLRTSIGHRYLGGRHAAALGVEWMPSASSNFSLYAEGRAGEDDLKSAIVGIRGYFGPTKSLMRRHREDDPVNQLTNGVESLGSSGSGGGLAFCPDGETQLPPEGISGCPQ